MGQIGFAGYDDAGHFIHNCAVCGVEAPFGYGYFPQRVTAAKPDGELGTWYCRAHRPDAVALPVAVPLGDLEACHVERDHEGIPLGPLARAARLKGFW